MPVAARSLIASHSTQVHGRMMRKSTGSDDVQKQK